MNQEQKSDRATATVTTTTAPRFVTRIRQNDVLLGRGAPYCNYEGNAKFRELIQQRQHEYTSVARRRRKQAIAREILAEIERRKGRFLRKVESKHEEQQLGVPEDVTAWVEADEDVALEKIKQALRHCDSSRIRSITTTVAAPPILQRISRLRLAGVPPMAAPVSLLAPWQHGLLGGTAAAAAPPSLPPFHVPLPYSPLAFAPADHLATQAALQDLHQLDMAQRIATLIQSPLQPPHEQWQRLCRNQELLAVASNAAATATALANVSLSSVPPLSARTVVDGSCARIEPAIHNHTLVGTSDPTGRRTHAMQHGAGAASTPIRNHSILPAAAEHSPSPTLDADKPDGGNIVPAP
jgi:hypothetical protein